MVITFGGNYGNFRESFGFDRLINWRLEFGDCLGDVTQKLQFFFFFLVNGIID